MNYEYIAAGISIINDIEYADGTFVKGRLGGCAIFAYGGIRYFTDSVLFLSSGGSDFFEYYGTYFKENGIAKEGIYFDLPYTHHTLLKYEKDGTWSETSIYGEDYFTKQRENNRTSLKKLRPFLNENTKGLYLDAAAQEEIFEEIKEIRKLSPDIRILWEPPTFSSKDPLMRDRVLQDILKCDCYSMNLDEASAFFGVNDRTQIIGKIMELDVPCFLREGENGSSWIEDKTIVSHEAIEPEKAVDVTGCGNTSAAAALYLRRENRSFEDIVYHANKAAAKCSRYEGPMPLK
ncbi:MAG: carbohydrate kinase family protein [Erysipelotrichaceae bacterium]|nr:carbohydrate kinase family protein [Erysipelotrichaceae bacterium]